ncbi:GNAT family N-acetyltransferase [Luteolibacter yonseiensis]|uniref:GNAT family N-acetyltransferase n=1 Tax=Luteolibacter yonseiensis TaxID=1144680 RepID=A0A934R159_9BACT|nr:GNAT family N-acetyltransferase [Luteolibacter yonseiensis]MBK1814842.1 GNAT family N-acetyltransferase [Luteolibacter yonseiensis]
MNGSGRFETILRDGTPIIVRPLVPDDRPALAEAYRRLSPEARYNRFWTHTGEVVGDNMLTRVLHQDPATHVSWAVLDPTREFSPMGGASWWRTAGQPGEVEISFIVLDDDQRRGIGTLLLAILWLTAFRAGAETMTGHVLTENRQAAGWMRDCGARGEWDGYKLSFRWDLDNLDALPETRAAAELAGWLSRLAPGILG